MENLINTLKAIHEQSSGGVLVVKETGDIIYCNKEISRLVNLPTEMILGKNFYSEIPNLAARAKSNREINENSLKAFIDSLINTGPIKDEAKIIIKEQEFFIEHHSHAFYYNGHYYAFMFVLDTTEKHINEVARDTSEKIMNHDIRALMNPIIGFSQLILDEIEAYENDSENASDSDNATVSVSDLLKNMKNFSQIIYNAGNNVLTIIDNQSLVANIQKGQYRPNRTRCNFLTLLKKDVLMSIKHQGVEIRTDYFGNFNLLTNLEIDSRVIKFMLINLIKNACEACEKAKGKTISLLIYTSESELKIVIKNPGAIPREIREKFMTEGATFGKRDGTGLGAFSAKLIAEANGGKISFETSDEENTTAITVTLPL